MQNNIEENIPPHATESTNVIIDENDIQNSKIIFFKNGMQDIEIKFIDIVNYIEGHPSNNIVKEIIEHYITTVNQETGVTLRTRYESDLMRDIGSLFNLNFIIISYAKKNIISYVMKKFAINLFNHCIGLIVVSMASFDKETCIKYVTYCINLTKKIIEFTNDEINKSTFLNNKLEQNLVIIKNDQKVLMEEINKNSSLVNEQNTEIKKINEKIELINDDVDEEIKGDVIREPIGRNVASIKRGGSAINKKNVENSDDEDDDEEDEDDDEEDEDDDEDDENGDEEDTPLSRESDEEQIVGASNLPKQIIMK